MNGEKITASFGSAHLLKHEEIRLLCFSSCDASVMKKLIFTFKMLEFLLMCESVTRLWEILMLGSKIELLG